MENILTLRGVVLSKYKTIGAFAEAVGWKRNKASRILNGVQEPNSTEIQEITACLELDNSQVFMQIFFASLSTLWTNKQTAS